MKKISVEQKARAKRLAMIKPPKDGLCTRCHEMPDFRGLAKHHIVARSQGGKDNLSNLEWLCAKCHGQKHRTESLSKPKPIDNRPCPLLGIYGPYSRSMQVGHKVKGDE